MEKSGAKLTYEYLNLNMSKVLKFVNYIEDRDLWRFNFNFSKEVNAHIRSYPMNFAVWTDMFYNFDVDAAIQSGINIIRREQQIVDYHCRFAKFHHFDDYQIKSVNATVLISEICHKLCESNNIDFALAYFRRTDGMWQYSLRSIGDFDVSFVAKKFGGGGHKNAAGFESKDLLV